MTEDEAKTKWCPHAVASHTDPRAGFHADDPDGMRRQFPCIASACMAWRGENESGTSRAGTGWSRPKDGHGYCGLAGVSA